MPFAFARPPQAGNESTQVPAATNVHVNLVLQPLVGVGELLEEPLHHPLPRERLAGLLALPRRAIQEFLDGAVSLCESLPRRPLRHLVRVIEEEVG